MKRLIPLLLLMFLLGLSLACQATSILDEATSTPRPRRTTKAPTRTPRIPTSTPIPASPAPNDCPNGECIVACVGKLDSIVDAKNKKPPRHNFEADEEYTLVTYSVEDNEISNPELEEDILSSLKKYQKDSNAQQQLWDYFAAIIPLDQRKFLKHYLIFTDGESNVLASVAQSTSSMDEWDLSVDILDTSNPKDLTFTLVHEFGHLLTLNPDQVIPSKAIFNNPDSDTIYNKEEKACTTYFPGEGCSHKDSYINQFFERFWPSKFYKEWKKIDSIEDPDEQYDKLDAFYEKYKKEFVTDYAPTSPAEDIAESWSFFVLKKKPKGSSIANQKVLFFYEFPELVSLREEIANNLCAQLEK